MNAELGRTAFHDSAAINKYDRKYTVQYATLQLFQVQASNYKHSMILIWKQNIENSQQYYRLGECY